MYYNKNKNQKISMFYNKNNQIIFKLKKVLENSKILS